MVLLIEWWNFEFWKGIKDGLESIMYLYQAIFTLTNFIIAFVSLFISFKLYTVSIATLKQIEEQNKEIQQQRLSSYRPDLVVEEKNFKFIFEKLGNTDVKFPIKHVDIFFDGTTKEFNNDNLFEINLLNIGLGPAREVNVELDFNGNEMMQKIIELLNSVPRDYQIVPIPFFLPENEYFIFTHSKSKTKFYLKKQKTSKVNYYFTHLLNYSQKNDKITIHVMEQFKIMYQLLNYYYNVKKSFPSSEKEKYLEVEFKISISYKDISDVPLEKNYLVSCYPKYFSNDFSENLIRIIRSK